MKRKTTSLFYSAVIARLMLITLLSLLTTLAYAQAPAIIGAGALNGTSANSATGDCGPMYRSTGTSNFIYSRHHYLYTAAELATAGITSGSIITELAWNKDNACAFSGPATFEIWLKNSSLTTVQTPTQTWATLITGSTQVYNNTTLVVGAATGYVPFILSTPFVYTGGAIEISVNYDHSATVSPWSTLGISWTKDNTTGTTISYCGSTASTSLSNARTVRPQLRITYNYGTPCTSPPVAGTPVPSKLNTCPSEPFSIQLNGSSVGSGLTLQWEKSTTDSVGPYVSTSVADSNRIFNTSQTAPTWYRCAVTCGGITTYSSAVKIITPTIQLAGTYTVNPALPLSTTNYHTLAAFATEVSCIGVSSPVIVNVAPGSGPYNSSLLFGSIPGASDINTISINGNGNTITSASSPIITFAGSSYITIDSFNIIGSGTYVGFGIHVGTQSHHLTFKRNKIDVGTTATATTNAGIVASGSTTAATTAGNNADYLTITNNEIIGGYYSIVMVGSGTYLDNAGHTITNNKLRDYYVYGVYLSNADTALIANNDINRFNKTAFTTLGGIYLTSCRNTKVLNNKLHDFGAGTYTTYPIQVIASVNVAGFETEISNNLIYSIANNGIFHGIHFLTTASSGVNIYHNTIQYDVPTASTTVARGINFGIGVTNCNFKNNIISITGGGTGVKTGIYVTTTAPTIVSNNNVINVNTSASNNVGFWTTTRATLLDWQTASTQDASSVTFSPVFANVIAGSLIPLSSNCDNIGVSIASVTTDITGALRSGTPDPGAYEFTGIAGDIAVIKGELKYKSVCYSAVDTVSLVIKNVIGTTADFNINPLKVIWKVTGPVNTVDSFMINSGTLDADSSLTLTAYNVNMTKPGAYQLNAIVKPNAVNLSANNDTLVSVDYTLKSILSVSPKTVTVTTPTQTVEILANSTLFPGGAAFFSEVAHYKVATGAPTAGWPAYLTADDYVEITGVPGTDFAGYVIEEWTTSTTAPLVTSTFPSGSLFSPNGTMIVATGQLAGSVASPSNFYYHTSYSATIASHSSTGDNRGYIIKNPSGTIIDATVYGTYTFPAASGVTTADWSGSTPIISSSGNTMNAPDNNSGTCWVNSGTVPQTPNVLNAGISIPVPASLSGFDWNYLGSSFSTSPRVTVGPYTTPGIYKYVASYTNACGTFYDTVTVTASSTVPVKLVSFTATKANADVNLNWNTASEVNNSHFEIERSLNGRDFKAIGRVTGMGTTSKPNRYEFVDVNATNTAARILYYRLKQVDNDGSSTYSRTAVVTLADTRISGLSTHPNPSNGVFTISAEVGSTSAVNMKVVNIMGATVWSQTVNPVVGANAFETQLQLPNGVYMLLFEQNGETNTHKFVIAH